MLHLLNKMLTAQIVAKRCIKSLLWGRVSNSWNKYTGDCCFLQDTKPLPERLKGNYHLGYTSVDGRAIWKRIISKNRGTGMRERILCSSQSVVDMVGNTGVPLKVENDLACWKAVSFWERRAEKIDTLVVKELPSAVLSHVTKLEIQPLMEQWLILYHQV